MIPARSTIFVFDPGVTFKILVSLGINLLRVSCCKIFIRVSEFIWNVLKGSNAKPAAVDTVTVNAEILTVGRIPFSPDPEKTRVHFRALRELRDQLEQEVGMPLPELSMGMSHDLEVAIEEGSTWVRIGTDLFGARG